jgi:PAT family beta-lactamase induction signal transducer AmpG
VALSPGGVVGNVAGTFIGGLLTAPLGLGRSLWIFGFFQIFSNAGYALIAAEGEVNRTLMLSAIGFETFSSGLGSGAFSVLLLRMTQKRFSATQYALFSSLFGLPRILAGPIAGFSAYAVGWETFFWATMVIGIPGMVMLSRFVPFTAREPEFRIEPPRIRRPLTAGELTMRGLAGTFVGFASGALLTALLAALKVVNDATKAGTQAAFDMWTPLISIGRPVDNAGWLTLIGLLVWGITCGLFTAAVSAARHGAGQDLGLDPLAPDIET